MRSLKAMRQIQIYTRTGCPFSINARKLLRSRGLEFEEVNITDHPERREEMIERSGGQSTFPQLFFGSEHIGGFDQLKALDGSEGLSAHLQ